MRRGARNDKQHATRAQPGIYAASLSNPRMRADAPRDLLTLRREPPSVRLSLRMPRATVRQQPEALQTPQELRDLPRVLDPGVIGDFAVARIRTSPRQLRDTLQHTRSASTSIRIGAALQLVALRLITGHAWRGGATGDTVGAGGGGPARALAAAGAQGAWEHDHRHHLPQQLDERPAVAFQ